MEFDLDKALEDVPIHVEDTLTSSQTPSTPSAALLKLEHCPTGVMVELPSEEEKKLQHFTKLRPRRNKKTHSSKVPVSGALQPHTFKMGFSGLVRHVRKPAFKNLNMGDLQKLVLSLVTCTEKSCFLSDSSTFFFQQINSTPSQDGEQNGLMGRVDEGVDEFFSKKVTKMDSK